MRGSGYVKLSPHLDYVGPREREVSYKEKTSDRDGKSKKGREH